MPTPRLVLTGRAGAFNTRKYVALTYVTKALLVRATWDDEAHVWVTESDDVPGLATEADSLDALLAKLRVMIPELVEANGGELPDDVPFELLAREPSAARPRG